MATQHGIIKLKGTIGDLTFYKGDNGTYGAKSKSEVSAERIATDPKFLRTRENNREFSNAGTAGKTFREAFQLLIGGSDKYMTSRLTKIMMRCLKDDTTSVRGQRNVADGDMQYLMGFDFNIKGKLGVTMITPFSTSVTRLSGITSIIIPPFVPTQVLSAPLGATHYKITAAAAELDFASATSTSESEPSTFLPIDNATTVALSLQPSVTANSTKPIFQVLSIQFYQEVNGEKYALNNGSFDAVKVVNIDL